MNRIACAVTAAFACAAAASLPAAQIGGRYAARPPADDAAPAADAGRPMVEITAHRNAFAVVYEAGAGRRKRRGWGLLDGEELAVSLSTGGAAYGVAVYHHVSDEHAWTGPWISSLDGGASLGKIRFEDGPALAGRHAVVCSRPGAGTVSGTVEVKPAADGYQLTFQLGRVVYYRGVGLLLPGDRLAVAWSFGSAPEIAAYEIKQDGALAEHHVSWTAHPGSPGDEQFLPITNDQYLATMSQGTARRAGGSSQIPLFAIPPDPGADAFPAGEGAAIPDAAALILGPVAPQVKAWSYQALMRQYGADGWAERWLSKQLTPEELRLLRLALHRHETHGGTGDQALENRSIGTLIEEERARVPGR